MPNVANKPTMLNVVKLSVVLQTKQQILYANDFSGQKLCHFYWPGDLEVYHSAG